jgi:hypothetical protein
MTLKWRQVRPGLWRSRWAAFGAAVAVSLGGGGLFVASAAEPGPASAYHAVAIYDYSQRNHDSDWLLVQVGVALRERGAVKRDSFSVVMPGGRVVPLATQEQFLADSAKITKLRQNASIFRRDVISYFPKSADGEFIRWFALPGDGTVRDPAIVPSEHGVIIGELYFKSPTLRWDAGTYRFVFDNDKGHAELPIRLE